MVIFMNTNLVILLLIVIGILTLIITYLLLQRNKVQNTLDHISKTIDHVVLHDTDEKMMFFSDNEHISNLLTAINLILDERQKVKADYRRSELSSKRMLSNISHYIKTPLTVILGYSDMLLLSETPDMGMIEKIKQKTQDVINLTNKFFTLSKIESGDMKLDITRINLSELCRKVAIDFYQILLQKDIEVNLHIPETNIVVSGNEDAISRILTNLISNSIRYGFEGKYIEISLDTDSEYAYVNVIDKGKGIEKQYINNVFDRLYTLDDSRNPNLGGNGLGLAIAKNLAEKQNGTLTLKSIPYEFTTFTLKLKLLTY